MNSHTAKRRQLCTIVIASLGLASAAASAADSVTEALTGGKVNLDMRYRYENVDQDSISKKANASTLRTRLGYTTGTFYDFGAMLEAENVTVVGSENYNSSVNGKTQYPTVLDPDTTEINQAFLSYVGLSDTTLALGRQRIILDNARWVGNVGWRQNEQTYDAFSVVNQSLPDTKITYGYLDNANRVVGDDAVNGDARMNTHIINIAWSGLGFGTLTVYDYLFDSESGWATGAQFMDTQTPGVRFTGSTALNDSTTLLYTAEYAQQSDYADSSDFSAPYLFVELGGTLSGITAKYGYEKLGSDDGSAAVQTPLATLHAHNGWADQFAAGTPANGLIDQSITVSGALMGAQLALVYHDYAEDAGGGDNYGTEWGLTGSYTWDKMYTVGAKYAAFSDSTDTATFVSDVNKFWVWGEVKF